MLPPKQEASEPAPEGNHVARLYSIINIGSVEEEWEGEKKLQNKIRFTWELCNKKKAFKEGEDERPWSVSAEYTFTMGTKGKLRGIVEGMVGKLTDEKAAVFNVETLLGQGCLVNVSHKTSKTGNKYAIVLGTSPLPEGIEAPAQVNPNFILGYGEMWDAAKFERLPNFLKEKMKATPQYKAQDLPVIEYPEEQISPDDIPF